MSVERVDRPGSLAGGSHPRRPARRDARRRTHDRRRPRRPRDHGPARRRRTAV